MTLPPAQYRVVRLLATGWAVPAIATELHVSVVTVRTYIRRAAERVPGAGPPMRRLICWYTATSQK